MSATGYGQTSDLSRVAKTGDAMSGTLVLNGNPAMQSSAGAAAGDVWTSDAAGNGAWRPAGSGAGQLLAANNLSDVQSPATSRSNLGLGSASTQSSAAFLQPANNLSDVGSAGLSRFNLGLGSAALLAAGAVAQTANNLSDLSSAGLARANLGLGSAAVQPVSAFLQPGNNLSDVSSAGLARVNLGLSGAATIPLPVSIANGGTGSSAQSFVDLTQAQNIGGVKTFTSAPVVPTSAFPESAVSGLVTDLSLRLQVANNLSDVASAGLSRTNLGVPTHRGTWSNSTVYNVGDTVVLNSRAYQAVQANTGHSPLVSTQFLTATPGTIDSGDSGPYEMGIKIQPSADLRLTGVAFYKATTNTGTHVGRLWQLGANGTYYKVNEATFTGETASGYQTVSLSANLSATGTYIVSCSFPNGHYSFDSHYYDSPVTVGSITAPTGAGMFAQPPGVVPNTTANNANYWVIPIWGEPNTAYWQEIGDWQVLAGFPSQQESAAAYVLTQIGALGGIAGLDGFGKLISTEVPTNVLTTSTSGTGDLGATYAAPTVVSTHLAAPLPVAQGGTGSATQNWVDLTTAQLVNGTKTWTSAGLINAVGSTSAGVLPYGRGNSTTPIGLSLLSTHASDDVSNGTDGTGRLNLYSFQRANVNGYGETIRNFLMRYDAKAMTAWYGPAGLYNGSGDPSGSSWAAWAWTGAHYEANDHASIHAHWEVEVPDATGALQGRFAVNFGNPSTGAVGLDRTTVYTNLADLHVYCHGSDHLGADQQQQLRLTGAAGFGKPIEWNNDNFGSSASRRWVLQANASAESSGNVGTDFTLSRYSDTGVLLDIPITVARSTGAVTFADAVTVNNATLFVPQNGDNIALSLNYSADNPTTGAINYIGFAAASNRVLITRAASADTSGRFALYADGTLNWGSGSATRDTNLYRKAAGLITTDNSLDVAGHAIGLWNPRESGFVAATGDPRTVPSGVAAVLGTIYLSSLFVARSTTVTKILWGNNSSGSAPTSGQNFVALVDPTGSILASVNVDGRVASTGPFTETIASQSVSPGQYRIAFLFNAGTAPQPYRHSGLSAALVNAGIASPSNYLNSTNGTSAIALPGSFTLGNNASSSFAYWCAIQ